MSASGFKKIEECLKLISRSEKILIFTGAGISTGCGIPDFRSSDGLYSYAEEKYNVPYPEAVFDIDFFNKNPIPFFKLSKDLMSEDIKPSMTHKVIKKLEDMGKLEVVVTQNIDMLHEKCGNSRILSCHGSYETGTCRICGKNYIYNDFKLDLINGDVSYCPCGGVIKPDITFFGEALPEQFYTFMKNPPVVDIVLVMGTSLEVSPANSIPLLYKDKVPLIMINRDSTNFDSLFNYKYSMDCDKFSELLSHELTMYKTT